MNKMLRQYRGETEPERTERFELIRLISTVVVEARALAKGKCEIISNLTSEKIVVEGVKSDLSSALSNQY